MYGYTTKQLEVMGITNPGFHMDGSHTTDVLGKYKGYFKGLHWFTYGF